MHTINKSNKLLNVCYDIRGPVLEEAKRIEEEGQKVLKLNIGNPAPFGFDAPDEIVQDMIRNLPNAQGYCESKGLFSARKAVMHDCQNRNIKGVSIDDIYIGNGVSELITLSTQALLNNGDELLIPAPDYPLWTAATSLAGGAAVHYICDEQSGWIPDIEDIKRKISPRTRGIVVINPNNPTGAVYPDSLLLEIIELARQHKLVIFADEIYDRILYDGATHTPLASLCDDVVILSFNGLSKSYRAAGFRSGWMIVSGPKHQAKDYIEGLDILSSMRLCANVPSMHAIQTALGGYQSINELILPGGRLKEQRDICYQAINNTPGLSCTNPQGALYMFVKMDKRFNIQDDERFAFDLLQQERILVVQGTAFNWPNPDHFRIVFLPHKEDLISATDRISHFFERYKQ
jgi:alanine-synthesizing transaminase